MDFLEYCGALSPWATFNVHRKKGAPFFKTPEPFMLRARGREAPINARRATSSATVVPALQAGPYAPPAGMRFARPGERPPSKYGPDNPDPLISRFDAYMHAVQKGPPRYAR